MMVIVDADTFLVPLHCVNVNIVAEVLEIHVA
jgi:hypothetical protein